MLDREALAHHPEYFVREGGAPGSPNDGKKLCRENDGGWVHQNAHQPAYGDTPRRANVLETAENGGCSAQGQHRVSTVHLG